MGYATCCPEIEALRNKQPGDSGFGLYFWFHSKSTPKFLLEYRKDWGVPAAEARMSIKFCPYCGSELKLSSE